MALPVAPAAPNSIAQETLMQNPNSPSGFYDTASPNMSPAAKSALPISNVNTVANPLANNPTVIGAGAQAPDLGVTAGSAAGGGGLTQGTALPNITTTQKQATATPQFYTDYLNNLAREGNTAAKSAQFVGPTDLQNQAFGQTMQNVGNYQPALTSATNLASDVGNSNISQALGNLNQSNIANYLAPQATAGIVGTGQFGSSRGVGALGQVINQADIATQAQQAAAMQQDQANRIAAANSLGNLATTTQNLGLGDVNALATLGAQQQQIAQNQQLFPMQQLTAESNLLKGATIPTATSSSYTGPIPGAYNASPLSQIAGLGSLAGGISSLVPNLSTALAGTTLPGIAAGTYNWLTGKNDSTAPTITDTNLPKGYTLNENGYLVDAQGRQYAQNSDGSLSPLAESGANTTPDQTPPPIEPPVQE